MSDQKRTRTRKGTCCIPSCAHDVRRAALFPLCTDHLLRVWAFVENDPDSPRHPGWYERQLETSLSAPRSHVLTVEEQEARKMAERQKLRERSIKAGTLYVLDTGVDDTVKIGWTSRDIWQRLAEYPRTYATIVTAPGTRSDERDIHRSLKIFRVEGYGNEWYHTTGEVIRQINDLIELSNMKRQQDHANFTAKYADRQWEPRPAPELVPRFESIEAWREVNRKRPGPPDETRQYFYA